MIGYALQKVKSDRHLPPPDQEFLWPYNKADDWKELKKNLKINHLSPELQKRVKDLVIKYFCVFRASRVKVPVRGYKMVIDIGDSQPIATKPRYWLHESKYMIEHCEQLLKDELIEPCTESPWSFPITLAAKPHQEHITDWDEYIWRFCINYIRLNPITKPVEYPIPRYDEAINAGFGTAKYCVLLDAFSGYHQIKMEALSKLKTAFYDLKDLWTLIHEAKKVLRDFDNSSSIIVGNDFAFALTLKNLFSIIEAICQVAQKHHLTFKFRKAQFLPQGEFPRTI